MREADPETGAKYFSALLWHAVIEQRREAAFVKLAREKIEPCLQFNSFDRTVQRREFPSRN